nr:ubiquitin specific protease 8 [Schmidtea mediterranea]
MAFDNNQEGQFIYNFENGNTFDIFKGLQKEDGHFECIIIVSEPDLHKANMVDECNGNNCLEIITDNNSNFEYLKFDCSSDQRAAESREHLNATKERETEDLQNMASDHFEVKLSPVPLINHGVNCYMNAAIQSIFPALLYLNTIKETIEYDQSQECGAIILMESLLQAYINQEEFSIPICIYEQSSLEYFSLELSWENMEDAHEFLNCYLDKLNEELKGHSKLQRIPFEAAHDSRYFCNNCGKSNNDKPNIVVDQVLFVSVGKNMTEMIENYLKDEVEGFNCENCEVKNGSASSEVVFSELPQYLVVCIKRFATHSYYQTKKINDRICIDEIIEIPYKSDDKVLKQKYRLVSVVNHTGSLKRGHYFTFLKHGNFWYKADDDSVRKCELEYMKMISTYSCYIEVFEKLNE